MVRPKIHEGACAWWLGLGLRVIGLGGTLWEGEWTRAHAHVDSQSPATGYWARCVLSARGRGYHEGATTFTHCRWAGEFRCWKIFSGRKLLFNVTEKQGGNRVQSKGETNLPPKFSKNKKGSCMRSILQVSEDISAASWNSVWRGVLPRATRGIFLLEDVLATEEPSCCFLLVKTGAAQRNQCGD